MKNEFENLSLNSILSLVDLLAVTSLKDLVYIRRRFEDTALGFDETIRFLADLDLVEFDEEIIERTQGFQELLNKVAKVKSLVIQYIIELMLDSKNAISKTIQEYLSRFNLKGDGLVYKPVANVRRKESGIRNLLIEFGIIEYSDFEKFYYITEEYLAIFVKKAQDIYQSPNELEYLFNKQKEIGYAAELAILEYEKKRMEDCPKLLAEIQLISQINVKAGYDIRSCELESSEGDPIIRYIEVKAVSLTDFKFFWSRNEIEIAKKLGERYYLYLLPVLSQEAFDIIKLEIISNAYKNVFLSETNWPRVEELYSIRKNPM